jgi:hypothetical protein
MVASSNSSYNTAVLLQCHVVYSSLCFGNIQGSGQRNFEAFIILNLEVYGGYNGRLLGSNDSFVEGTVIK